MSKKSNKSSTLSLNFATFHVNVAADQSDNKIHPNANLTNLHYVRNIELLFRSVRVFHPYAQLSILTSAKTDLSSLKINYGRLDSEIDVNALMLSRTLAQQKVLESSDFEMPIVLIDSDILLNGSLDSIFENDFDIALTWRKSLKMPINGGMLILNNKRPEVVRKFFDEFVSIYRKKYIDSAGWYGDQLALRDVCDVTYREMRDRKLIEINGCKVLFLPCDRYNFSPDNNFAAVAYPIPKAVILHFKGQRKRLMDIYWRAHLQLHESRSLIGFINAFFARKLLAWRVRHEVIHAEKDEAN